MVTNMSAITMVEQQQLELTVVRCRADLSAKPDCLHGSIFEMEVFRNDTRVPGST